AAVPPGVRAALEAVEVETPARGVVAHCLARAWLAPDLATARAAVAAGGGTAILPDGTRVSVAGIRAGGRPGATVVLAAAEPAAAEVDRRRGAVGAAEEVVAAEAGVVEALHAAEEAAASRLRAQELDAARAEPEARDIQRRLGAARQALAAAEQRSWVAELRL